MSAIICFGQQPCGFFPRRFLYAKIVTARRLAAELDGEIVFFCHDSDHDPRETQTILTQRKTGELTKMNFPCDNKIQRKWSPLYLKHVSAAWRDNTARQLPAYVDEPAVGAFRTAAASNAADFCLEMYSKMGLLEGMRIVRSSDPATRQTACEVEDFFVDVPYEGETVRARWQDGTLRLHEGGGSYRTVPGADFGKGQISPTRDTRLRWMQSVVHCTHYVTGAGEAAYLNSSDAPEITFVTRDPIERSDEAYIAMN